MPELTQGKWRVETDVAEDGTKTVMVWCPLAIEGFDEVAGYCLDFPFGDLQDLLDVLTRLKTQTTTE